MKGNLKYSSIIVSIYFFVLEGSGPLKSRLSLSKSFVALMSVARGGL